MRKSAIRGEGYGSRHTWVKQNGPENPIKWNRFTIYQCLFCGECFRHEYHIVPDIFKAMKRAGIEEACKK